MTQKEVHNFRLIRKVDKALYEQFKRHCMSQGITLGRALNVFMAAVLDKEGLEVKLENGFTVLKVPDECLESFYWSIDE